MATLSNRSFKPMKESSMTSVGSKMPNTTGASSGWNEGSGGAGPHRPVRGGNRARAGSGSDRLPQGKLDSPKVP